MTTPSTGSTAPDPRPDASPDATARPRRRFRLFRKSAQAIQDRLDARHPDPDDLRRARAARAADLIGATHHPATDDAGREAVAQDEADGVPPVDARGDSSHAQQEEDRAAAGSGRFSDGHDQPGAEHPHAGREPDAEARPPGESGDAIGRMHAAFDELPDPDQLDRLDDLAGLDQPAPRARAAVDLHDDRGNDLRAGLDAGDDDGTGR